MGGAASRSTSSRRLRSRSSPSQALHDEAFEAVCDVLEKRIGAERVVLAGQGHGVQRTGVPFNARLERFLAAAEPG